MATNDDEDGDDDYDDEDGDDDDGLGWSLNEMMMCWAGASAKSRCAS